MPPKKNIYICAAAPAAVASFSAERSGLGMGVPGAALRDPSSSNHGHAWAYTTHSLFEIVLRKLIATVVSNQHRQREAFEH